MGRPVSGPLGSYPSLLVEQLGSIRKAHAGWGAHSILLELEEAHGYARCELPSVSSVKRYLKWAGLSKAYEPHGKLPYESGKVAKGVHALWEVDAQGATKVEGIGYHALINMKDQRSLTYCMTFPVSVAHQRCQPTTIHYKWAFRLAFEQIGMPEAIQVDKDSVFFENHTKSPFPSRMHLWWVGLGFKVFFIKVPPPLKQAKVERSHQTIEKQVITGQNYDCWKEFFQQCNSRRKRLNERLPSASLDNKAPFEAFPEARHSKRKFSLEEEYTLFDLNRVYGLLDKGTWFRKVSKDKTLSIGAKVYYLKKATPDTMVKITFSKKTKRFIVRNDKEQFITKIQPKGMSEKDIIGNSPKELKAMKYKLKNTRKFPL